MHIAVIHGDPGKPFPYYPNQSWSSNDNGVSARLHEALALLDQHRFSFFSQHETLLEDLTARRGELDLVLNLCDDGFMNDPDRALHICAALDLLGLPYTGSGVTAMALTADKHAQLCIAEELGVRVPRSRLVHFGEPPPLDIRYPAFVKPNATDGSVGIDARSVARDFAGIQAAFRMIAGDFGLLCGILVQEFLPGPDLCVGLLGNPPHDLQVLPITVEDYSALPAELPKICGYEAKWLQDSPYWQIQTRAATLAPDVTERLVSGSIKLFERFRLSDYARFDWRLDAGGEPVFLEANANCGWCWDGHLAKAAAFAGITYSGMMNRMMNAALRRLGLPC